MIRVLILQLYKNSLDFNNAYFFAVGTKIFGGPGQHLGGGPVPPGPNVEPPLPARALNTGGV